MKVFYRIIRVIGAYCLGALIAMVAFGLLLGLAWLPILSQSSLYRLVSLFFVSGLATMAGGFAIGLSVRENSTFHAGFFGLGFGLMGSIYTLGLVPAIIGYALATGVFALAGGYASRWLKHRSRGLPRHQPDFR